MCLSCVVVGFLLGYRLNHLPEEKVKPVDPDIAALRDQLKEFEFKDFQNQREVIHTKLSPAENALVDKLLVCGSEKKKLLEDIKGHESKPAVAKPNKPETFIERFLGEQEKGATTRKMLPGKLSPSYSPMPEGSEPPPTKIVDGRYRQIFPDNAGASHLKEDAFGYVDEVVDDVDAFLDANVTSNPGMTIVHNDRKAKSVFFQNLASSMFEGQVKVFTKEAKDKRLMGKLSFQSPDQNGQGWLVIRDEQGAIYETRTFTLEDEAVWRYNLAENSVVLLSDRCQWSDAFVHEFKDMFYLSQQNMLVGNIYCREQFAKKWNRIGTFEMEQVGF